MRISMTVGPEMPFENICRTPVKCKRNTMFWLLRQNEDRKGIVFLIIFGGPEKGRLGRYGRKQHSLLGAGVLGDGLGSLRNGVLGKLTRKEKTDSGLDLAR